jgi:hypothetical protein
MFKRTRGYVVLTLLIVTGLASQVYSPTISSTERHFLTSALKDSKKNFSVAVNGLSQKQLNFKLRGGKSIKEYCTELEEYNNRLWSLAQASLQTPKEETCCMNKNHCGQGNTAHDNMACTVACKNAHFSFHTGLPKNANITDCIKSFQAGLVKYSKTTTEDLHSHLIKTPESSMDIYQALLSISANTNNTVAEINKVRSDPHFPRK